MKNFHALLLPAVAAGFLICAGCGQHDKGPRRYNLSGTVTYQGKPVPTGEISFLPDSSQGNTGPGAVAFIQDGRYETRRNKGVTPGPTVVIITGYDGVSNSDSATGKALFSSFDTRVDLEDRDAVKDFVVEPSPK